PGTEPPLLVAPRQPHAPQADALGSHPHRTEFANHGAIEFMRETIRRNPGEVSLLCIGPMTNIALLFATYPEIPALLGELVLMCGIFTRPLVWHGDPLEWNAICDPHAAAIVYNAPVARHRSVGLDVTEQVVMPAAEVRRRFAQHPILAAVL